MLLKVAKMMAPSNAITFPNSPDKVLSWLHFFPMTPKTTPCQTMLGKVGKLMPPDKATNFPKIHVKVSSSASLFQKWPPRPPPVKPCWQKLKKDAP
jgi:hypothetical protein